MFKIFWEFLVVVLLPQVKRLLLVINWYILVAARVAEWLKTLNLRKLATINFRTWWNYCLALSPPPEIINLSVLAKISWKQKLNFSHTTLFYMQSKICLKYFVNDCWLRAEKRTSLIILKQVTSQIAKPYGRQ